ncbi:hypothetical protein [Calothrix sp. UHCC 0171]|uniref:hypothetical protein n=1 Tax=Calothrix sp. UHCC 0171 TaxID=3110245 RepID=UPI002B20313C|nr:hypothetical protein [Calothrix sp. UHCC 0171]MEA5569590.1 hypothetical protein [Calothrix sp. UHCC 0171]
MNVDFKIGLVILFTTALCVLIPKSFQMLANRDFCPLVEESSKYPIYYSQNFAIATE